MSTKAIPLPTCEYAECGEPSTYVIHGHYYCSDHRHVAASIPTMTPNAHEPSDALAAIRTRWAALRTEAYQDLPNSALHTAEWQSDVRFLLDYIDRLNAAIVERDTKLADLHYLIAHSFHVGQRVYIAHLADAWRGGHGIVEKIDDTTLTVRSTWNGEYINNFPAVLVSSVSSSEIDTKNEALERDALAMEMAITVESRGAMIDSSSNSITVGGCKALEAWLTDALAAHEAGAK